MFITTLAVVRRLLVTLSCCMRGLWPVACFVSAASRTHGSLFIAPPSFPTKPRPQLSAARLLLFGGFLLAQNRSGNSTLAARCPRRAQLSANARSLPGVCGRVLVVICSLNALLLGMYAAPPPATTARRRRPRPYKLPVVLDHKEMVVRTRTAQAVFTAPSQHMESASERV